MIKINLLIFFTSIICASWATEMAQWVRVLFAKPKELSSISGTHIVEENQLPDLQMSTHTWDGGVGRFEC